MVFRRVGLSEAIHGFGPSDALRATKIVPDNFVELSPFGTVGSNLHPRPIKKPADSGPLETFRVGLSKTIHGFRPAGALGFASCDLIRSRRIGRTQSLRDSGFSPSRISQ